MHYRQLGATSIRASTLSFGASPLGDVYSKTDPAEGVRAVHSAIDAGINYFDVSPYYGLTLAETRLGIALAGRRHQVVLATKCGRYGANEFDFSATAIQSRIEASLQRLQTDYVDMLFAHDVEFADPRQIVEETLPAMRTLQRAGKVRFIGISGYPLHVLQAIAEEAPVDAMLSYCHYNPLSTDLEDSLLPFVRARNIGLINASPLHMGLLHGMGAPGWHPAPMAVKSAASQFVELCRGRGLCPATVALQFCLENSDIATTLVGMMSCKELNQNLEAFDLEIDPELRQAIADIAQPVAHMTWHSGRVRDGQKGMRV